MFEGPSPSQGLKFAPTLPSYAEILGAFHQVACSKHCNVSIASDGRSLGRLEDGRLRCRCFCKCGGTQLVSTSDQIEQMDLGAASGLAKAFTRPSSAWSSFAGFRNLGAGTEESPGETVRESGRPFQRLVHD